MPSVMNMEDSFPGNSLTFRTGVLICEFGVRNFEMSNAIIWVLIFLCHQNLFEKVSRSIRGSEKIARHKHPCSKFQGVPQPPLGVSSR